MKTQNKIIIGLVILLLLLLGGGALYISSLKNDIDDLEMANRKLVLKNDALQKVSDTQYRKLVADTLTKRQLQKKVDSLGLELDAKPKVIYRTKIEFVKVEKEVDSIDLTDSILSVIDHYPKKENYFVKYSNKIDINTKKGVGLWDFNPVDISIVLSQRKDGIWQSDIKVPEFMKVGKVDVEAIPLELPKVDNFGWLLGVGYGQDFKDNTSYLRLSSGIRYKKFYIDVGGSTNQTIDGGIKIEF